MCTQVIVSFISPPPKKNSCLLPTLNLLVTISHHSLIGVCRLLYLLFVVFVSACVGVVVVCIKQLFCAVFSDSTGKKRKASASKNTSTDGSQLEEAAEADEPQAQANDKINSKVSGSNNAIQ